ncbi:Uncharacterised protein [Janthinobacterium lividum]|nr:Uncharacterised protein [Janthinobacterium lividum]
MFYLPLSTSETPEFNHGPSLAGASKESQQIIDFYYFRKLHEYLTFSGDFSNGHHPKSSTSSRQCRRRWRQARDARKKAVDPKNGDRKQYDEDELIKGDDASATMPPENVVEVTGSAANGNAGAVGAAAAVAAAALAAGGSGAAAGQAGNGSADLGTPQSDNNGGAAGATGTGAGRARPAFPAAVSWMSPGRRLAPVAVRARALRAAWADLACWARSAALASLPQRQAVAEAVALRLAVPAPEAARGQAARVVPEAAPEAAQAVPVARAARPAVALAINPPPPS